MSNREAVAMVTAWYGKSTPALRRLRVADVGHGRVLEISQAEDGHCQVVNLLATMPNGAIRHQSCPTWPMSPAEVHAYIRDLRNA